MKNKREFVDLNFDQKVLHHRSKDGSCFSDIFVSGFDSTLLTFVNTIWFIQWNFQHEFGMNLILGAFARFYLCQINQEIQEEGDKNHIHSQQQYHWRYFVCNIIIQWWNPCNYFNSYWNDSHTHSYTE